MHARTESIESPRGHGVRIARWRPRARQRVGSAAVDAAWNQGDVGQQGASSPRVPLQDANAGGPDARCVRVPKAQEDPGFPSSFGNPSLRSLRDPDTSCVQATREGRAISEGPSRLPRPVGPETGRVRVPKAQEDPGFPTSLGISSLRSLRDPDTSCVRATPRMSPESSSKAGHLLCPGLADRTGSPRDGLRASLGWVARTHDVSGCRRHKRIRGSPDLVDLS
jgi:hypothetical protein